MTVEKLLDDFKRIAEVDHVEKVYDDQGVYQGALVTYTNPLMPELKNVYHPYIPLQIARANGEISTYRFRTRYGIIATKN